MEESHPKGISGSGESAGAVTFILAVLEGGRGRMLSLLTSGCAQEAGDVRAQEDRGPGVPRQAGLSCH